MKTLLLKLYHLLVYLTNMYLGPSHIPDTILRAIDLVASMVYMMLALTELEALIREEFKK